MTEITINPRPTATLIKAMASDDDVVQDAQVSVHGVKEPNMSEERKKGMINYLVKSRHGTTVEGTFFKFHIKAPIFVAREAQRHRHVSVNEWSGRYSKLFPEFYIPDEERPLVNAGSGAHPNLVPGDDYQYSVMYHAHMDAYQQAWDSYEAQIEAGIANEVARSVLPLGVYTEWVARFNARSLMHFLSLRTDDEKALIPSKPQKEIEMITRDMEKVFAEYMPYTYEAFVKNGRMAP